MAYECKLIETYPSFGPDATTDGSMEDDPITNWPVSVGATAVETVIVHGGEKSIRLTAGANNDYISQSMTVVPEQRYQILTWGYSSGAHHRWRVRIYIAGAVVWTGDWHDNVGWERDEKFYRIPLGITTIQLRLEIETNGEIVYFDDVTVRQEAPVSMNEIDLLFRATDDWSLLQHGIKINDPIIKEIWGGELEDQLVRREEGKRVIPVELNLGAASADTLIEDVNGLEQMLRNAARFRKDGWGGEVFLQFKTDAATHSVWYPVIVGQINKAALMKMCCSDTEIDKVPIIIICEAYWEADNTYDLNNYFDNPAFWRGATPPGDHWTKLADPAANLVLEWDRELFVFQCRSLKMIFSHDAVNDLGVTSGLAIVRGETEFYLELRGFHPAGCDDVRVSIWDLTGAPFEIAASVMVFDNQDDAWETLGTTFTTVAGARTLVAYVRRMAVDSTAGDKEFWIDALYLDEGATVPTGWCSARDIVNHLDDDAGHINTFCVAEIPGEVEAEMRLDINVADEAEYIHIAKRTRNDPCLMQWQLLPCEGYTTAEGGAGGACVPGLTDAACIDTDKIIDANSPSGSRITCNFAGAAAMNLRAYWEITTDLFSYYGKWMLGVLCDVSGTTDTIRMRIFVYQDIQNWGQGYVLEQTVPNAPAGEWELLSGWQILSLPVGTHDDDLWDVSNRWRIEVHAETDGTTDDLWIAGAYLIPLDEGYFIGGDPTFSGGLAMSIVDLDGIKGVFPYAGNRRYSNVGCVGKYPSLTPEVENWFYFALSEWNDYVIANTMEISLRYRPRGIFLRGLDP